MNRAKRCAYCDKPAHKHLERVWNPHVGTGKADLTAMESWEYRGNKQVLRRSLTDPKAWGSKRAEFVHSVTVWDGETYVLDQDPFCSLRCAQDFGRAAYRQGYRLRRPATAVQARESP